MVAVTLLVGIIYHQENTTVTAASSMCIEGEWRVLLQCFQVCGNVFLEIQKLNMKSSYFLWSPRNPRRLDRDTCDPLTMRHNYIAMMPMFKMGWICRPETCENRPISQISQCIKYPTMHHFVTEMCTCLHISVTKWFIVVYRTSALLVCDLCNSTIGLVL